MNRRDVLGAMSTLALSSVSARAGHAAEAAQGSSGARALVFDAYGTLFDVHSVVALCNELFPGHGDALSQRWRAKQLEYSWLLSLMGRYEDFSSVTGRALTFACRALALDCREDQHRRLMDSYLRLSPFPDVAEGLRAVSGRPLAILSNGSPSMLTAAVSSARLDGVFGQVLSVDAVRVYKPSPRVYRLAVDRLGVPAAAILFVSSNAWDVGGAKAFGFRTCWVNRDAAPAEELGLTADLVVRNLAGLAQAVKA